MVASVKKRIQKAKKYLEWEQPDQAIAELRPVLAKKQEYSWIAYHMMGIAFSLKGDHKSSLKYLKNAVESGSEEPETYHMLSVNHSNLGHFEAAEQHAKEALDRNDDFLKAWLNLGSIYRSQAKLEEALKCFQKANQLDPQNAGVAFRIGEIYRDQGDVDKAFELFDITLKIDKNHKRAILEKADIFKKKGKFGEAEKWLGKAKEKYGDQIAICVSEAELFKEKGDYDRAIKLYKELIEKKPDNSTLRVNYAICLQEIGRFEESEKNYRQAIKDAPENLAAISNYLMGLHYNPENSKEKIYKEHVRLGKKFANPDKSKSISPSNKEKNKHLKVGFISGGFRSHPVGWMIAGALEQLPKEQFQTYCYTTNSKYDLVTQRIHQNIDVWRSVVGYSTEVIDELIRKDELDILVDLSGHAEDSRLPVMARKPAPIIVKWVGGLFNTTGLSFFDYLISDWYETPEGEEGYYTEKLVRMPDDYIVFTPPGYAPDVDMLPAEDNGYVTFGCFNNPTKINDVVLKQWAKIMLEAHDSRLYLKSKQYNTSSFRTKIIEVMGEQGISKDRIEFQGQTTHDKHLEAYNKVDVALDPWPYSGGLTTCEALYVGVPVITYPGPTFAGRHSTTHLINAGLEKFVAESWDDYISKAISLANDRQELKQMRSTLRNQMLNAPVCDGKRFGAHLSVAFREMWKQWVEGQERGVDEWQDHIEVKPLSEEEIEETATGPDKTIPVDVISDKVEDGLSNGEKKVNEPPRKETQTGTTNDEMITPVPLNGKQATKNVDGHPNNLFDIETKDGIKVSTPADLGVLTTYVLLEQGEWFEPEMDFVNDYLQSGMQVIDAGAAFGVYALPMAKQVGSEGAVYAFEPGAVARRHLEISKIKNDLEQLKVIGRGLGAKTVKARLQNGKTPELNRIGEEGEEVSLATLDTWWNFAGQPDVDLVKIDVNGMEVQVLKGAANVLNQTSPVLLVSIGENKEYFFALRKQLTEIGYVMFEYIPGPGLLAEHEPDAGVDAYLMNVVAIPEGRIEEFKKGGWIFNENVTGEDPDVHEWKSVLSKLPWAKPLMNKWEQTIDGGNHGAYLEALNLICLAERINSRETEDKTARSRKGALLLQAAQQLIGLLNSGMVGIPAALTCVRVMMQLGKKMQAVEIAKQLMETVNSAGGISVDLPFLPPLENQDNTDIQTDLPKWLTVRIVEAWISLQSPTTYMAGRQEKQMLKALEGNPEVMERFEKPIELSSVDKNRDKKLDNRGSKPSGTFVHLCFNHVYAKSLSDLLKYTNENSNQEHWLFIEQRRAIPSYSADISDNPQSTFFDRYSQLKEVLHECLKPKVDGVFVHGLFFDWQKQIINEIGSKKHIGWEIWGGDLYKPINDKVENPCVRYINSLLTTAEGDLKLFREYYGKRSSYSFSYPFPGLYGHLPKRLSKIKTKTIIVGNSGDRSNKHIDILKELSSKKDIKEYNLVLPVAYNFLPAYKTKLEEAVSKFGLTDITTFHKQFIPPEEYIDLFLDADMLITAHNRQQSIGNILISLFLGNRTFLRETITVNGREKINPGWDFLQSNGLSASQYKVFKNCDRLSDLKPTEKLTVNKHRSIIIEEFGIDKRAGQLMELAEKVKNGVSA